MPTKKTHVTIFGAGYAGLLTALALERKQEIKRYAKIRLIDRNPYHLLQTELHAVAAGLLSPNLAAPRLNMLLCRKRIEFICREVEHVDIEKSEVVTTDGRERFDILVAAPGSVSHTFGIPGMDKYATGLKSLEEAEAIRGKVNVMIRESRKDPFARPSIAIIGAGATGVELAAYLRERAHRAGFDPQTGPRVSLVESASGVLPGSLLTRAIRRRVQNYLLCVGVDVLAEHRVAKITENKIHFEGHNPLACDLIIWTGGVRAAETATSLSSQLGASSRVVVSPHLNLPDHPNVFVLGDAAFYTFGSKKRALPCAAQYAMQQASVAAQNIADMIVGRQPKQEYEPNMRGEFVSVSRDKAVAWSGPLQFFGADAQLMKKAILAKYLYEIGMNPARWFAGEWL